MLKVKKIIGIFTQKSVSLKAIILTFSQMSNMEMLIESCADVSTAAKDILIVETVGKIENSHQKQFYPELLTKAFLVVGVWTERNMLLFGLPCFVAVVISVMM